MYDKLSLRKGFISREHIKPPRLVDNSLMASPNSYIERTDDGVISLLKKLKPTHLVVWNGDFNDNERGFQEPLIKKIKSELGIKIVYCEHGWLPQAKTFSMDLLGSNGGSSFSNSTVFEIKKDLSPVTNKRLQYDRSAIDPKIRDFIYVPLQLNTDTQIRKYSPFFKDMATFISHVVKIFKDKKIVIKVHPKDTPDNLLRYRKLCQNMNNVIFASDSNNIGYCKHADRIIAINSTVINEALLFHKPVMTYGKNNFYGKGVTYEVKDINDLKYQYSFLEYQPNKKDIENYLCYLLSLQFDSTEPNMKKALMYFR